MSGITPPRGAGVCRAWVNFDATATIAIRASGNVSSITDNGVGDYTVNFSTPMPDANYSAVAISGSQILAAYNGTNCFSYSQASAAYRFQSKYQPSGALYDNDYFGVSIFR